MASFGERVVGAMKLDANTFEEIERDPSAIGQAAGVIVLAAVSTALGWVYYNGLSGILSTALMSLIGYAVWAVIIWLVGTKVMPDPATKADFPETFRTIGFAASPGILGIVTIIPVLGWILWLLLWLWQVVAMVVAVRQVLDYSTTGKAAIVVVIGFLVNIAISIFLSMIFLGGAMLRNAM
jgi:Yip1 domain